MNTQEVAVNAVCEECGHVFKVSNHNMTYMRAFVVDKETVLLTFYSCPECKRIHFVQIDDRETVRQLHEIQKAVAQRMVGKYKKKPAHIRKAQNDLAVSRMALMKKFAGKFVCIDDLGVNVPLTFSIQK